MKIHIRYKFLSTDRFGKMVGLYHVWHFVCLPSIMRRVTILVFSPSLLNTIVTASCCKTVAQILRNSFFFSQRAGYGHLMKLTVNTVFTWGTLLSMISPPICLARSLAMVSPSPLPCISRFLESSIVNNRSNTFCANAFLTIEYM